MAPRGRRSAHRGLRRGDGLAHRTRDRQDLPDDEVRILELVGVQNLLLLDVVLGYGSHADPAAEIAPAIKAAKASAKKAGRNLVFVGFVCGTKGDPQGLQRQEAAMRDAGMILTTSNAQAVRLAAQIAATAAGPAKKRTRNAR